jgi:hypothetical protein
MYDGTLNAQRPTVLEVQTVIGAAAGITLADIKSECRKRVYAGPRQVAMYLAREMCGRSYPVIGRAFGDRDHTTVLFAHRKVGRLVRDYPEVGAALQVYRARIVEAIASRPVIEPTEPPPPPAGQPSLRWATRNKRKNQTHRGEWVTA